MPAQFLRRHPPGNFAQQANMRQAGPQVVMDVFGDARAVALHRALALQVFQPEPEFAHHHHAHGENYRANDQQTHQSGKP